MTRFELHIGRGDEWYIFNTETNARYISLGKVVDKLNEQQATISYLEEANPRLQEQLGETLALVDEQQATIKKLQDLCGQSDSENAKLRIENEQLRKQLDFYLLDEFEWKEKYGDVLDE